MYSFRKVAQKKKKDQIKMFFWKVYTLRWKCCFFTEENVKNSRYIKKKKEHFTAHTTLSSKDSMLTLITATMYCHFYSSTHACFCKFPFSCCIFLLFAWVLNTNVSSLYKKIKEIKKIQQTPKSKKVIENIYLCPCLSREKQANKTKQNKQK